LAVLVNAIPPYRIPIFEALAKSFRLSILHAPGGRRTDTGRELREAVVKPSRGIVLKRSRRTVEGGIWENQPFHITPGYVLDLLRINPDALITNEMGFRTLVALAYGGAFRRPVWVWWGGTLHTERNLRWYRKWVRWVIAHWARRWISYGNSSTEYLVTLGVSRKDILQIQNGVDEHLFAPEGARTLNLSPKPVILHVGRMVRLKGIDYLLDACAVLQREGLEFSTVLVGDGPERPAIDSQARRLGLRHVHILGALSQAQMPAIYRSTDLLVVPTLQDVWSLVVNEALWSGVPVLASVYAGCAAELLPADQIFNPTDHSALVAQLRRAITEGLPRPDTSKLMPVRASAAAIIHEVSKALVDRHVEG